MVKSRLLCGFLLIGLVAASTTSTATAASERQDSAGGRVARAPLPPGSLPLADAPRSRAVAVDPGSICYFGACYDYVAGRQYADVSGAAVRLHVARPEIDPRDADAHSLHELAVQSVEGRPGEGSTGRDLVRRVTAAEAWAAPLCRRARRGRGRGRDGMAPPSAQVRM